ncbi:nuclear transport factor 2 family protein [Leptolyngbya sp. AN03gr2]|uniref:nuclear transport factor 2 family protein n=1 Tax=unclassified Leptolyngbya TaxID=2650499 RepID=UPI003D3179E3
MQSINNYIAAWNAKTPEERQNLLVDCLAEEIVYLDPHVSEPIQGIEGMQALIERFRGRFDHKLEPDGEIDTHHQVFRLRWRLQRETGEVLSRGLMVGDLSTSGVLQRIVHFVD